MIVETLDSRSHELVLRVFDENTRLEGVIALHNTLLGPALGGCRLRRYSSFAEMEKDALWLSEGMTYKNCLAGLPFGGGKMCVQLPDALAFDRRTFFKTVGRAVESLGGKYITAKDMGTTVEDVMLIQQETEHVVCRAESAGGFGDPSPWTALGVFLAMQAAALVTCGSKSLKGKTVLLEGVGKAGGALLKHLLQAGARVTITDTNEEALDRAKGMGGSVVAAFKTAEPLAGKYDFYCPSAVGQTVSRQTLQVVECKFIVGCANNQLSDPGMYEVLEKKKIVYAPDFVVNAGGVIAAASEFYKGDRQRWVLERVLKIHETTQEILLEHQKTNIPTEKIAKEKVSGILKEKSKEPRLLQSDKRPFLV